MFYFTGNEKVKQKKELRKQLKQNTWFETNINGAA
jgi:hypothetical protein